MADAQTRTYAARVKIKAPDARVLLGMTASVRFATADAPSQSLSVPLGAVFQKDGKPALWIVDAEQALVLRPVEVLRFGERSAVLAPGERGGVRVGERIVVAGVHKLRAGEKIKAVERQPATER